MELIKSKLRGKEKMALVQGQAFRCVAVETDPGRWKKISDGTDLPPVLEIIKIMGFGDQAFFKKRR